jgi:cytoskeleton protein RodZ
MNDPFHARMDSSPGATLGRAREAQNLSIVEIARHLKITPAQVEALEAGAYDRLPGRVFVRGFVKNYARLVKIDPTIVLRQIEHDMPKPAAPVSELRLMREVPLPIQKRSRWPLFAGIAFAIVAALAVYEFGFNDEGHDRTSEGRDTSTEAVTTAPAPPAAATAPPAPAVPAARPSAGTAPPAAPTSAPSTASFGPAPAADSASRAGLVKNDVVESAARAPRAGERQLHFRFDDDSWVEIRDRDNRIIFSKLNRAGAEERVTGRPPLKLIVGNARKVHLTYDTQSVDLTPHIGVTVARVTIE